MALTIQYTPGYVWTVGEIVTEDKLNLASNPITNLFGTISSASIADGSVTLPKLSVGMFTADAAGRAPFVNGWLNAPLMDDGTRTGVPQYAAGVQTSNVYAVTLAPVIAAYITGMTIRFQADTANTGACGVAVNGQATVPLKKNVNVDPAPNDITAGEVVTATYDGTNFQMRPARQRRPCWARPRTWPSSRTPRRRTARRISRRMKWC